MDVLKAVSPQNQVVVCFDSARSLLDNIQGCKSLKNQFDYYGNIMANAVILARCFIISFTPEKSCNMTGL